MNSVKITTFNIEWMVSLFSADWNKWDGTIPESFPGKSLGDIDLDPINDVDTLCKRISGTIKEILPDILCIQEGPPKKEQLEKFVSEYLDDDFEVYISNSRWQTLAILVRRNKFQKVSVEDSNSSPYKDNWSNGGFQPWGSISKELRRSHNLYRRPLQANFEIDGTNFSVLNLHTKSKWSLLKTPEQWKEREPEAIQDALVTRQKLSVEVYLVRKYVESILTGDDPIRNLILLGDLNDGPVAEELEEEFLIHNIVDELVGSVLEPTTTLTHCMDAELLRTGHTTEFHNPVENGKITREIIDHIFSSQDVVDGNAGISIKEDSCVIEDEAFDMHFDENTGNENRESRPSDHRPVSVTLLIE